MQTNESGRSMIEMLGVLAIIGVMSVGGLAGYTKAMNQYKAQQTISQIHELASRLTALGDQTNSYAGLTNASAIKMGVVPATLISGGDLVSAFGSTVTVAAADLATTGDNLAWTVEYRNVPKAVCTTLASQNWQDAANSALIGVGVAGATATDILAKLTQNCNGENSNSMVVGCPGGTTVNLPLTPALAAKGCSCSQDSCKIALKFF